MCYGQARGNEKGVTQEEENPSRSRRQGVQSRKLAVSEGRFYAREEICSRREEWIVDALVWDFLSGTRRCEHRG